jgi:hypothetical protein
MSSAIAVDVPQNLREARIESRAAIGRTIAASRSAMVALRTESAFATARLEPMHRPVGERDVERATRFSTVRP